MQDIIWSIVCLYFHICFARFDEQGLSAPRRAELARSHRRAAGGLLLLGALLILPCLALYVLAPAAWATGREALWGHELSSCLALASLGLFAAQFLLVVLAFVLCVVCHRYEARGLVLALSELLHASPRRLQFLWRTLACLPLLSLIIALGWMAALCAAGKS